MDPVTVVASSPFLHDSQEFQSGSPYEGFLEQDFGQDNPHFPPTPSYNGSYQNSPFSGISELPPFDTAEGSNFALFAREDASGASINDDYDPSEYDLPNGASLLTFDDTYMTSGDVAVSITPPAFDQSSPQTMDHSSPASSAGGEDGRRSRASSTSSYMHPNSPPLDFAQNFESLHFESPAWPPSQLPSDRPSPPAQKPQSPPQLLIPESPALSSHDEPPTINAPEGDGSMLSGPQLHIVPATPIGGGGAAQNVPFLQQGMSRHLEAMSRCFATSRVASTSVLCKFDVRGDSVGQCAEDLKLGFAATLCRSAWRSEICAMSTAQLQLAEVCMAMFLSRHLSSTLVCSAAPIWPMKASTAVWGIGFIQVHPHVVAAIPQLLFVNCIV